MSVQVLPPRAYLDTSVFARERELFMREWICVGRETDLAQPGAYFALTVMAQPVVVWRDQQGRLRAFENVCRHRMAVIADGCGVSKYLRCPYHGWTYTDDGKLRAAPQADSYIAGQHIRLPEYRVEIWCGFIFVNLDPHADPLAPRLTQVEKILAPYQAPTFEFSAREIAAPVNANWKLMLEVGLESYHFPYVHKSTLAANLGGAPNSPEGNGSWTVSVEPRTRPLEPQAGHPPGLSKEHRATTYTFGIFPCTVFNVDVDNIVWFTLLPVTESQTASIFGTAARTPELIRILGDDQPTSRENYFEWGARLGAEDNAICERVQAGIRARGARPGPIIRSKENCLYEFQNYLRAQIPEYPLAKEEE